MSKLEDVVKRLKSKFDTYENEREQGDDGIYISLACDLADSIPYLIEQIERYEKSEMNPLRRKLDQVKKELEYALKEIKSLKKEKEQNYHKGYQQGAFDEKMSWINQGKVEL
jgi:hypothetical protein